MRVSSPTDNARLILFLSMFSAQLVASEALFSRLSAQTPASGDVPHQYRFIPQTFTYAFSKRARG